MGIRTGNPRGRPKGATNKRTREKIEQAAASGLLPHEFLLSVARGEKIGDHEPTFAERIDAAKSAAPYFAPRLAQVNATVRTPDLKQMSEAELDRRIAFALAGEEAASERPTLAH